MLTRTCDYVTMILHSPCCYAAIAVATVIDQCTRVVQWGHIYAGGTGLVPVWRRAYDAAASANAAVMAVQDGGNPGASADVPDVVAALAEPAQDLPAGNIEDEQPKSGEGVPRSHIRAVQLHSTRCSVCSMLRPCITWMCEQIALAL